jgi:hypothetical protein
MVGMSTNKGGLDMNGLDFVDNLSALKKLREAGNALFDELSAGCSDNWGRGYNQGNCMNERSILKSTVRVDGRPIRRHCCFHNCPKLD